MPKSTGSAVPAPSARAASATAPADGQPLLSIRNLQTYFRTEQGLAKAVDGVSFDILPDEVVGLVGESGSGKSVTSLSILRLIPDPPGLIAGGQILFRGQDLLALSYEEMRAIRGRDIAMIFQEPMSALNPLFTIGFQVREMIQQHQRVSKAEAQARVAELLEMVSIPDARRRLGDYPHQFSGGMRQRVMIAMALACHPQLLIADEPTTALDVTTQAQILELMLRLKSQRAGASILLITHDLAVVAETCQRVVILYGGKVQEIGTVEQIFFAPRHPYTQGLLASLPTAGEAKQHRLRTIPGNVPSVTRMPAGCKFCTRCEYATDECRRVEPPLYQLEPGHLVRCHLLANEGRPL